MAREEQDSLSEVMVSSQGFQVDSAIVTGTYADSRSVTPESILENSGESFLSDCSQSESIIMENSDTISAVSLESAFCGNVLLDDVASTISNTNSCPEFTRQPEPVPVFSERIQPSLQAKSNTAPPVSLNPTHKKIKRIPSGANPRHRVSTLYRPQRSQSAPQIQINPVQLPRRFSHSQINQGILPNTQVQQRNNISGGAMRSQQQSLPQVHQKFPTQQQQQQSSSHQQQQQQIIYLQIPNPGGQQSFDSQEFQQQISSQLHQIIPQICTQLLSQMGSNDATKQTGLPNLSRTKTTEENAKNANNQIPHQNDPANLARRGNPRKRKKNANYQMTGERTMEVVNETDSDSSISPSQQQSQTHTPAATVPTYQTVPQIAIPLSQELLLRCQQFRDHQWYYGYQPRLETIHEESLSLKHFKMNGLSKPKIMACILTVLFVIVVIVLAGDKDVAVIIVSVVFIIFVFGLIGFLYLNSSKNSLLRAKEDASIQVGTLTSGSKSSAA